MNIALFRHCTCILHTLIISGLADPPSTVSVSNSNSLNQVLSWDAPFTLDITDVVDDIIYRVCNNITNTCVDTTNTIYVFPTTCDPVAFDVSACNPVGCSDNATVVFYPDYVEGK